MVVVFVTMSATCPLQDQNIERASFLNPRLCLPPPLCVFVSFCFCQQQQGEAVGGGGGKGGGGGGEGGVLALVQRHVCCCWRRKCDDLRQMPQLLLRLDPRPSFLPYLSLSFSFSLFLRLPPSCPAPRSVYFQPPSFVSCAVPCALLSKPCTRVHVSATETIDLRSFETARLEL